VANGSNDRFPTKRQSLGRVGHELALNLVDRVIGYDLLFVKVVYPRPSDGVTVPAEWEISVGFALSRAGKITDPGDQRSGNPDFIFVPTGSSNEVIVEVTSLSDRATNSENPVDEFSTRLGNTASKEGITRLGAFDWNLGYTEVDDRIVIGVPSRRDIQTFFKTPEFREFLSAIKASPTTTHKYQFKARGAESVISFAPGQRGMTGSYRSYKVAQTLEDSRVFNSLKDKERQLLKAALNLPALVFLCDNNSYLLGHTQTHSPNTFRIEDIATAFLNGRPHWQEGSLILQEGMPKKGKRIHAVVTLTVHQPTGFGGLRSRRELRGRLIPGSHCTDSIRSEDFRQTLNAGLAQLPVPVSTPINAMRQYKWPSGFGGGMMKGKEVTISLLTLQKLLGGEISYAEFADAHQELAGQLRNLNAKGLMISSVDIEQQLDVDDDLVTLRFGGMQPDRLFDPER
jgi:hypothetical protein